ncbi:hypothetical protein LCGC14_2607220 [marine sediment metagenome]|uniref:Uncharacterized protein n=1 Tax=marine sediment metagenome TaxID=412755 RepID=A0A0F9CI06_9ZZZZ
MMEVVAIFVACQINLLICVDLPFIKEYHTFSDSDKCRTAVVEIIKAEQAYRIKNNNLYPIVMGKCKYYVNEN